MGSARMGVIIVNYGSHQLIDANLPSVPELVDVFVVDNWHSATERAAVEQLCADRGWTMVACAANRGFGAGANTGIRLAAERGCDGFLLLNPDARASTQLIDALRRQVQAAPLTLVAPRIEDSTGRRVFDGVELLLANGRMRRARRDTDVADRVEFWLTGACLAFHREALARVGGFAEDYFLYWEDVDFSVRARRAGCTLTVREDLVAVHDEGGTQGRESRARAKSDIYYFYNCRNRLLFAARLLPRRDVLRWVVRTPAASWEILMRGGRRQLLASRAPLWAAVKGSWAGLFIAVRALFRRQGAGRLSGPLVLLDTLPDGRAEHADPAGQGPCTDGLARGRPRDVPEDRRRRSTGNPR
jgi:N-acetylglucosaminyl-diphospho-decaprenol L-rhamnosyltransferase